MQACEQAHRQQRVATEFEEVIIKARRFDSKQAGERCRNGLFGRVARRIFFTSTGASAGVRSPASGRTLHAWLLWRQRQPVRRALHIQRRDDHASRTSIESPLEAEHAFGAGDAASKDRIDALHWRCWQRLRNNGHFPSRTLGGCHVAAKLPAHAKHR